jgi:hypothetical protein
MCPEVPSYDSGEPAKLRTRGTATYFMRYQLFHSRETPRQVRLWIMALAVLLIAGTLRFSALDRQGLWDDESFTLRALGIIAEPMTMAEGAPPLYFLLLRGWVEIVGTSLASVRAFSALWGTAGVALTGLFAGRAISPQAGLSSAALLSLHPFHLAYSQEARPYAMVFALATLTIWMAWEQRVWLFTLASTALLWTHPWGLFVWLVSAGLMIGAFFQKGNRDVRLRGWQCLLLCLLPLASAAPALWHFSRLSLFGSFWAKSPGVPFLLSVVKALAGGPFFVGGWQFSSGWSEVLLVPTFVCLWIAGLWREDSRRTRQKLLIGLVGLFVVPAIAGWFAPEASAHQRYWLAALPVMILLAARGWNQLPSSFQVVLVLVCVMDLSFSTAHYFTHWEKGNVLQAARWVHAQSFSGSVLIVPRYLQPLWKYHDRSGLPLVDEAGIDELTPIIAHHTQAILVTTDVPNPVQDSLDARFRVLERTRFPAEFHLGLVVTSYANRRGIRTSD